MLSQNNPLRVLFVSLWDAQLLQFWPLLVGLHHLNFTWIDGGCEDCWTDEESPISCYGPLVLLLFKPWIRTSGYIYIYIQNHANIIISSTPVFHVSKKENEKLGSPGELFQSRLLPSLKNEDKFLWCFVLLFLFLESCLSTYFWHLLELLSTIPPRYQAYQCRQVPQISECVT